MSGLFRYAAFGDSTAVGVGAESGGGYPERLWQRLRARGINAGLLNLGESGACASDLLARQLNRRIPSAELVTLGIGSNDLWRLTSIEDFSAAMEAVAEKLAAIGAPVIVSNLIDLSHTPAARFALPALGLAPAVISARVQEFNAAIAATVSKHGFALCDLHALGESELRQKTDYFARDGFHPSGSGYARWAEQLWPQVEPLLGG